MTDSQGFVYIATGDKFRSEAVESAESVKRSHPEANIALISDASVSEGVFTEFLPISSPHYSHRDKVENISRSPYDQTIFLDSDVRVYENVSELFDILSQFNFAASHDSGRRRELYVQDSVEINAPDCFPMVNSGVMVYDNSNEVAELFEHWCDVYHRHESKISGIVNQPSLREALYYSDISLSILPPEYNCRTPFPPYIRGRVRIIHGRDEEPRKVFDIINKFGPDVRRTFFTINESGKTRIVVNPEKWRHRVELLLMSVRYKGPVTTIQRLINWGRGGDF